MKKSKVTQVTSNGTWEGKFGLMYKFEISFENGDCGEYSSKSQDQTKFVEGQETEYEYTDGKFPKVKPFYAQPSSNGSFGYRKDDNVQELIVRQSSLKAAIDYCNNEDSNEVSEILSVADKFVDWVMGKEVKEKEVKIETKIGKDDLPF